MAELLELVSRWVCDVHDVAEVVGLGLRIESVPVALARDVPVVVVVVLEGPAAPEIVPPAVPVIEPIVPVAAPQAAAVAAPIPVRRAPTAAAAPRPERTGAPRVRRTPVIR